MATEVVLRIYGDRAVLASGDGAEADPHQLALSSDLANALHEWARVAAAVQRTGNDQGAEVVTRRGNQLAGRVATALGVPVSYQDPVTGQEFVVAPPERPSRTTQVQRLLGSPPRVDPRPPWGTGLLVALFIAVFVAVALLALINTLATETADWIAVVAALVVTAGISPSLWLGRKLPIVRWVVLGAAAGVVVSWIGVLVIVF
ncbi:DUF2537 domain-containing protein [Saccharomonospora sp. NPDC046836]|uniref:DUF2537 domain-containing protein n=1 Tax=Saccharomonospora sp. NPDC046836 TaxID=3156921 RepID=UPI0033E4C647